MALEQVFRVPKLGLTADEVIVSKWLKNPGDEVHAGDPFVAVETDKAILDVESPMDGYLRSRLAEEGAAIAVGAELAVFVSRREDLESDGGQEPKDPPRPKSAEPGPVALASALASGEGRASGAQTSETPARHRASPAVRRRAHELGIDLDRVVGSGPQGRIRTQDLAAAPKAPASQPEHMDLQIEDMSRVRRATARRMLESAREIPQFTLRREIDIDTVLEMREMLGESFRSSGAPLSLTDFLLQASAHALMLHPALRSQLVGDIEEGRIGVRPAANIGLAVATPEGLLVPVLQDVQALSLLEIARQRRSAVDAALSGRLSARLAAPACFTVSNLGPYDADEFHALVNPGEAAIVAVGAVRRVPAVHNGELTIRQRLVLTFTFDHRLVDGAEGAVFAKDLVSKLEGRDWRLV